MQDHFRSLPADAGARLTALEARVDATNERLLAVERLLKLTPERTETEPAPANPQPAPGTDTTPAPLPDISQPQQAPVPVVIPTPSTPVPDASQSPQAPVPVAPTSANPEPRYPTASSAGAYDLAALFSRIVDLSGKYGLAVIGSLLLAVTAVWGMTYVYQFIGPEVKLAAGALFAGLLIVFGEHKSRDKQLAWWSQAIIGAGYAIAYFVGYAAHNVPSLQLIASPAADSVLLLALALAGGAHAVWRRSEPIALLSVLLAFVTISLSQVTYFSVAASAVMLAALVIVIARMRWYGVYVAGSAASFASFMLFTQPQVMASAAVPLEGLYLSAAFLFTYWLAYNLVALLLKPSSANQRYAVLATVVGNAAAFLVPTMYQLGEQFPELRWAFLAVIGALYLLSAARAALSRDTALARVMLVLGLQLLTAAVPLKLDGNAVTAVWLLEAVGLTVVGMMFNMPVARLFGLLVATAAATHLAAIDLHSEAQFELAGMQLPSRSLIGIVAAAAFFACQVLYRTGNYVRTRWEANRIPEFFFYGGALLVAWLLPLLDMPEPYLAVTWSLMAVPALVGSRYFKQSGFCGAALLFAASAAVSSLNSWNFLSTYSLIAVAVLPFAAGLAYRFNVLREPELRAVSLRQAYFIGAALLLFAQTWLQIGDPVASVLPFAIEAALLCAAGLALRDSVLRQAGAAGFAVSLLTLLNFGGMSWTTNLWLVGLLGGAALSYRLFPCGSYSEHDHSWLPQERALLRRLYPVAAAAVLALSFLNSNLTDPTLAAPALAVEAAVSLSLGLLTRDSVLRWLGAAGFGTATLFLMLHPDLWDWLPNLSSVALMALSGLVYRRCSLKADDDGIFEPLHERTLFSHLYTVVPSILLAATLLSLLDRSIAPLALAVQALVLILPGSRFSDGILRLLGAMGLAASLLCLWLNVDTWTWSVNLPVVALMTVATLAYRRAPALSDSLLPDDFIVREQQILKQAYPLAAALLMALTSLQLLQPALLPVAWSIEGVILIAFGFRYRELLLRGTGLLLFIALVFKLVGYDLRNAAEGLRILSWFGAAVVTLAAAWAFFKFSPQENQQQHEQDGGKQS